MPDISLVPIGSVPAGLLASLRAPLERVFNASVDIFDSPSIDPAPAYDSSRDQYFSTRLLSLLLRAFSTHDGKILGITSSDLFVPVLTHVFGEAQLDGQVAIVSTDRLDESRYGLPPNPSLLEERLLKEAVHELGHTFGLVHCHNQECVMHSSSAVEEIDLKSSLFCEDCQAGLNEKR